MGSERELSKLRELNEKAEEGGGEERGRRQHEQGKLLARERLEILLDSGSFVELDRLRTHHCTDFGLDKQKFPGDAATYFRDGKKIHSFSETRWNLDMHREVMLREGFDYQVVIADNRPLIYEVERDLGVAMARAYNDTVARDIDGKAYFIGIAWVYLPDVDEAIRELRRAVNDLGFRGVKLMGGHANCDLDAEVLWPFYEEVCQLDVPILALSQLSRAPEARGDHRPQLSDLRESGALEQDADVVLFIFREEMYSQEAERRPEIEGVAELIVGKQRNGPTGTVRLAFLKQYTRFENLASGAPYEREASDL